MEAVTGEGADEWLAGYDVFREAKIRESFDLNYHLKHVDTIFRRVFRG